MKKDVFISYSRKDMKIADKICDALENADISYFIDKQDIGIGHPFEEIAKAIKECTLFLYLGSENAYISKYAPKEINYAIRNKEKHSILPYLIDNTPMPDEIDLLLCDYNWRTKREHPIIPTLIDDLLGLLGRKEKNQYRRRPHEKGLYSMLLISAGTAKLQVVKGVKELFGLNLKNAKDIVDAVPSKLPGIFSKSDVYRIKELLEEIGAKVNIQQVKNVEGATYYIEILSAFTSNIEFKNIMSNLTSFTTEEMSEYLSNTPCILPSLFDYNTAVNLMREAERIGTKIRLIPHSKNNSAVKFKMLTIGANKLQVVKYIKESLNIGLKDAKDLVDSAPSVIASSNNFEDTLWFVKGLRDCGSTVSIILKNI